MVTQYDNYQPYEFDLYKPNVQFIGAALEAKQKRFDTYAAEAEQMGRLAIKALPQHRKRADELTGSFRSDILSAVESKNGDYSRMGKDILVMKRKAFELMNPGGEGYAIQTYADSYKEWFDRNQKTAGRKDGPLLSDFNNMNKFVLNSVPEMTKDPKTGAWTNFNFNDVPEFVDANKVAMDFAKEIEAQIRAGTSGWGESQISGFLGKTTWKTEKLSAEDIFTLTYKHLANSPQLLEYISQRTQFDPKFNGDQYIKNAAANVAVAKQKNNVHQYDTDIREDWRAKEGAKLMSEGGVSLEFMSLSDGTLAQFSKFGAFNRGLQWNTGNPFQGTTDTNFRSEIQKKYQKGELGNYQGQLLNALVADPANAKKTRKEIMTQYNQIVASQSMDNNTWAKLENKDMQINMTLAVNNGIGVAAIAKLNPDGSVSTFESTPKMRDALKGEGVRTWEDTNIDGRISNLGYRIVGVDNPVNGRCAFCYVAENAKGEMFLIKDQGERGTNAVYLAASELGKIDHKTGKSPTVSFPMGVGKDGNVIFQDIYRKLELQKTDLVERPYVFNYRTYTRDGNLVTDAEGNPIEFNTVIGEQLINDLTGKNGQPRKRR